MKNKVFYKRLQSKIVEAAMYRSFVYRKRGYPTLDVLNWVVVRVFNKAFFCVGKQKASRLYFR